MTIKKLSTYYLQGIILRAGNKVMNFIQDPYILAREIENKSLLDYFYVLISVTQIKMDI